MKVTITQNKMIAGFVQIILLISEAIFFSLFSYNSLTQWCQAASVIILISIVTQIIGLCINGRLWSTGSIFIFFTYLINCSYCILYALDAFKSSSAMYLVFVPRHGTQNFPAAVQFAITSVGIIYLIYILGIKNNAEVQVRKIGKGFELENNLLRVYGNVMSVVFGSLFFISNAIVILYVFSTGDYSEQSVLTSTPFVSTAYNLQGFYFQGLLMKSLYHKQRNENSKVKQVFILAIVSILFSFLTGARSRGIMILLIFLIYWIVFISHMNWKKFALYMIAGLILLQLLSAVRYARSTRELSLGLIISYFFSFQNNILYETLDEFGRSIFVTVGFMNNQYHGGTFDFFLRETLSVLPRISSWGGEKFLAPTVRTGFEQTYALGSTYIADFYYYFGNFGQYVVGILGAEFATIDNILIKKSVQGRYISAMVLFPGIVTLFNSVRAQATLGIKMFIYSWIIFKVFQAFLTRKQH